MKALALAALAALTMASPASAKDAPNGYITGFAMWPDGTGFFFHSEWPTGSTVGCDTGGIPKRWSIDTRTAAGQTMMTMLITAKNTHQLVKIYGAGSCATSGANSEQIGFMVTDNAQ